MLDKMELTIEEEVGKVTADLLSGQKSIIETLRKNYSAYIEDISKIMYLLEDQVFSLYYCLDSEQLAEQYLPLNNSQDYNYEMQMCSSVKEALDTLINGYLIVFHVYNDDGSVGVGNNPQYVGSLSSPNHGVQCSNCGSTNLQYDKDSGKYYCTNKGCTAGYTKVVTYYDYAKAIYNWFNANYGQGEYFSDIEDNIRRIQTDLYIRNNFTDENYKELRSFIREDVYENSNYTSDNIVDNTRLLETARKFVDRAKQQLAIACVPQISISASVSSLLVQSGTPNEELFDDFAIGNYIRVSIDDTVYKLRIIGIKYDFENLEKVEVTFSNVTKSLFGAMSDIQSVLQQASSMATSFSSVAKQAESGQAAAQKFNYIKKEGLDSSLGAVKAAKNQEIVIDDNGILCRYYNKWLSQYDDRQLKIINQNIVMTDDAWENAKLAIGLGEYNGEAKWGVWADMLVGDLMITKDLKVVNGTSTVEINKDGIVLDGGAITWKNNKLGTDAINGLDKDLSDLGDAITEGDTANSNALDNFKKAMKGTLGITTTTITSNSVISPKIVGGYLYIVKDDCSVEIDPAQKYNTKNSNVIKVTANGSDVFHITRNGDGYFKGEIQATSGSFKGTINCGDGNFVVNSNGSLQSKGGINIYNDIVAWNGTSCFRNSADEFLVQQGAEGNPVVRFRITKDTNYMIGNNVNIYGGKINMGHTNTDGSALYSDFVINTDGSIDINNEFRTKSIILRNVTNDCIYGYNAAKTEIYKIAGVTYYADGGHTVDFGQHNIGTYIDGAIIWLRTNAAYVNDALIQTSDKRVKKDFISLKAYENFYMNLNPLGYKMISGTSGRTHLGFVAQEVEDCLYNNNLTSNDFAGFIKYNDIESNEEKYALRYEEFIALNTHMIQKLYKRIDELEKCINNN